MFLFPVLLSTRLVVGLLLASNIGLALGLGSSGRFDILNGTRGESACDLKDAIDQRCKNSSSTRRDFLLSPIHNRDDDAPLVPSLCNCNEIFFNILSACLYSKGNNILPNYGEWTQYCTTNEINVDFSIRNSEVPGKLGIQVPPWATMSVPGNSTFDIQRAVTVAFSKSTRNRWTTLQIVLPIIAAIVTLLISGVILLTYLRLRYQRKLSEPRGSNLKPKEWPKGLNRLHLHTSHKVVTTIDRDDEWEIDGPVADQRSFVNLALSSDNGQPVPVQSFNDMEMTDIPELDKKPKTVSSLKSTTEKAPIRSRLPWKRRPPQITFVPATPHFRVDDDKNIFTISGEAVGRNEINVPVARELADDVDHVPQAIDETRSLISPDELAERDSQEVILISKDGRSFTLSSNSTSQNTVSINSHIKIISPSNSSTSPQSAWYSGSTKYLYPSPISPPPASHAAPASPVVPQILRRSESPSERNKEQSLTYSLQPPFPLSPIKEASSSERSFSSSDVNLRRSPAVRRSSVPESFTSLYMLPEEPPHTVATPSPSSIFNPYQTEFPTSGPDLPRALVGNDEDNFCMEKTSTTIGQLEPYQGHFKAGSDVSLPSSFYHDPPPVQFQTPEVRRHPALPSKRKSRHPIGPRPSAFYAGPVQNWI